MAVYALIALSSPSKIDFSIRAKAQWNKPAVIKLRYFLVSIFHFCLYRYGTRPNPLINRKTYPVDLYAFLTHF